MAKLIANQLCIGIDLTDDIHIKPMYKTLENFTIGECDTSLNKKNKVKKYELVPRLTTSLFK